MFIIRLTNLNTSHVTVNLIYSQLSSLLLLHLNTSHVTVNLGFRLIPFDNYLNLNTSHVTVNPTIFQRFQY